MPAGTLANHVFKHFDFTREFAGEIDHENAKLGRELDVQVIKLVTADVQYQAVFGSYIGAVTCDQANHFIKTQLFTAAEMPG